MRPLLLLACAACAPVAPSDTWLPPTAPPVGAAEPGADADASEDALPAAEPRATVARETPPATPSPDREPSLLDLAHRTVEEVAGGVRLVSTLPDTTPPRAVLALPSGEEIVATPGRILLDLRLVLLEVEADRVRVGEIVLEGERARIAVHTLAPPAAD